MKKVTKSENEWKKELSAEAYRVLREKGTEAPFSGKYYKTKTPGVYACAACGNELFKSDAKFDSGTGWPSFAKPLNNEKVTMKPDVSHGMERIEVICNKCGSHLGHVFDDGPEQMPDGGKATGKRFCINSCALELQENDKKNP